MEAHAVQQMLNAKVNRRISPKQWTECRFIGVTDVNSSAPVHTLLFFSWKVGIVTL